MWNLGPAGAWGCRLSHSPAGDSLRSVYTIARHPDRGLSQNPGIPVQVQKSRFTRKIPGRVPTNLWRARRHIAFSQGQCATCGAQLLLKYAHRTMCCRYACLKAAAAKRRARHADGSADDAVAMCSASRSWRCLACTSAIPISSSQRSSATSWLLPTRPYATSRADRSKRTHAEASLTCVCLSLENCFFG